MKDYFVRVAHYDLQCAQAGQHLKLAGTDLPRLYYYLYDNNEHHALHLQFKPYF